MSQTAARPAPPRPSDVTRPADVFVVFGITGDLAKVMTFRSLYRLEQRGLLDCPIVGRRRRRLDVERPARTRAHVDRRHGRAARRDGLRALRRSGCPTCRATSATRRPTSASAAAHQRRCSAGLLPRDPAVPVRQGGQGARRGRADDERARRRREAVRPRPRVGPRARRRAAPVHRRVAALPDRPLPREDGPRGDPLPALREHDARAGLEPQLRRVVQITMAEDFGVEDRGHFYDPVGALRDVVVNHLMQVVAAAAMEAPCGRRPRDDQGRADRRSSARSPAPTRRTTCAASTTATATSTASRPTRRPRPTPRCGSTSTTGAGRACRSSSARASACPSRRPSCGSCSSSRRGSASPCVDARIPSPTSWSSSSTRRRASGSSSMRTGRDVDRSRSRSRSTWSSPSEGGEGATPYEVLLHAAMVGDSDALHPPGRRRGGWRIMQPLLDAPPPVHPYAPGSWGPAEADELVAGHGRWHEPVGAGMSTTATKRPRRAEPQSAAAPVAVPADRRLRVPLQLPHGRAGRARRRDRLAVRPALRLAERVRQPARPRRPGSFRFGAVRHQPPDGTRLRARHERRSRRPGRRRPAGSSCATR